MSEQCSGCSATATIMMGFCKSSTHEGSRPSAIYLCDKCTELTTEKYKTMGKPGQIIILPIGPVSAVWHDEANRRVA